MANWMRRLFHQWHDSAAPAESGEDWGFSGRSALVVIDDEYRLAAIQAASTPRERLYAASGWLLKLAKNGHRAFTEIGDPAIRKAVDDVLDYLASETLAAAGDLRDSLRKVVGPDFGPRGPGLGHAGIEPA